MARIGRPPLLAFPPLPLPTGPLTKSELARLLGCPSSRVSQFINSGKLTTPALLERERIDATLAVAQLDAGGCFATRNPGADVVENVAGGAPSVTYDQARTATELLKAHTALLDLRERHGQLAQAEVADGVLFDCMRAVRDSWLVWPARVASEMASRLGIEPAVLMVELERGVRRQLTELADPKADWRPRSKARLGDPS